MRFRASFRVPAVLPDRALGWWWDFREGSDDHRFAPGAKRRLEPRPDGTIVMHDEARFGPFVWWRESTTARREPGAVAFEGRNLASRFRGTYRFEPAGEATRIALDADIVLRGPLRVVQWLLWPIVWAIVAFDLWGHCRELRRDLAPARRG